MYHMKGGLWDVNISVKAWKSGGNCASEGYIWKVCFLGPPSPTTEVALVMARSLTDLFLLPNPCLIPFFSPHPLPRRVIISPSCQLDPIQKNPPSKHSQVNPGRESPWRSIWITGACWWGIVLIMVIEVGRFSHYGWYHSLGKGILSCMSGEGAEHKPACVNPLLCSDCRCNVTSCFQLCNDACYVEF